MFRAMVKALHAEDIEVILDVVYNHTAEGNESGPTYRFKGIDNAAYYLTTGDPATTVSRLFRMRKHAGVRLRLRPGAGPRQLEVLGH